MIEYDSAGFKKENVSKEAARKYYKKLDTAIKKKTKAELDGVKYFNDYRKKIEELNLEMDGSLRDRGIKYFYSAISDAKAAREQFDIIERLEEESGLGD